MKIKKDINISESTKKTIEKIITISIQDYRKYLEAERRKKQEEKNKNKKELYESSLADAETFITLIISNKIENIKIADVIQIFIHYDSIKKVFDN